MEKQIKVIGIAKWLCFPMGYIMYFGTAGSFGEWMGCLLGAVAAVSFWALMRNEQSRLIGQTIADDIREAISECGDVESLIEIKRLKSGIIARVYLINAKDKAIYIHRSITRKLDDCSMKKYLWIMQLTDMPAKSAFKETQRRLNEQLLDELLSKRKGDEK